MTMRGKLVLGVSLLLAAATSFAGSAGGQLGVQITLNNNGSNSCTSATGSGAGSSSVQVQCTTNVFVNIAQVSVQDVGRFMPGLRPARDSLLPDYCRNEQMGIAGQMARITCRLDDARDQLADAGGETDDGWKVAGQLYAVNTNATDATAAHAQNLVRRHLEDDRGTLTALRVAHADGHLGPVEMLISF